MRRLIEKAIRRNHDYEVFPKTDALGRVLGKPLIIHKITNKRLTKINTCIININ
jgi:hypothetical protein